MKLTLLVLLSCASLALAVDCSVYNYTNGPTTVTSNTTNYVCLEILPPGPYCPPPFQVSQNGACVRQKVLLGFLSYTYPNGTVEKVFVVAGNTQNSTETPLVNGGDVLPVPEPISFAVGDSLSGDIFGMTDDGALFHYTPPMCGPAAYSRIFSYPGFWTPLDNGYGLHVTAVAFGNHSFYVATEEDGHTNPIIWTFDTRTPLVPPNIFYLPAEGTAPFTGLTVTDDFSHLLASSGAVIFSIPIQYEEDNGRIRFANPQFRSRFRPQRKLTTGGTATLTYPTTSTNGATISAAISDSQGNAYYTEDDLGGAYSVQKIRAADIQAGTNPAPTIALYPTGAAGSVSAPVLDKYNALFWATGSSSAALNGVWTCSNVPATNTSPGSCRASTVFKWPVPGQVSGGNVVVTVNNIIYG